MSDRPRERLSAMLFSIVKTRVQAIRRQDATTVSANAGFLAATRT